MTVERLDFSKSPPGYHVGPESDYWYWIRGPEGGEGHRGDVAPSEQEVIAAAWAHHKARHDPPGMFLDWSYDEAGSSEGECSVEIDIADGRLIVFFVVAADQNTGITEARTAAWAWYEDALKVADMIEFGDHLSNDSWTRIRLAIGACISSTPIWPRALAWSSDQRIEVRRWLVDSTADMPEVLRG